MKLLLSILFLSTPFLIPGAYSNDLEITNVLPSEDYSQLTFDIAWKNSWRQTEHFHDAVWVFVKYKPDNGTQFLHGHITGGTAGNGLEVISQADNMGVFVRNATDFTGNIVSTTVTVDLTLDSTIAIHPDFKVYGLEMVYVPEGKYYVGDGNSTSLKALQKSISGSVYNPLGEKDPYITIISDASIIFFNTEAGDQFQVPSTFPNGYDAFYCMKYPFTQEQFVEYLNQLDKATQQEIIQRQYQLEQKGNIDYPFGLSERQGIYIREDTSNLLGGYIFACNLNDDGNYNSLDDGQNIAASFRLDYQMEANTNASEKWVFEAFLKMLNWCGLRPMTELEYEKACRGTLYTVKSEYAWGTAIGEPLDLFDSYISNQGTMSERYIVEDQVPWKRFFDNRISYRVGMFADVGTGRLTAQASYWGIQDLSGNGFPVLVNIYNSNYTGMLGNGNQNTYPLEWFNPDGIGTAVKFISRISVSYRSPQPVGDIAGNLFNLNAKYRIGVGNIKGRGVRQP